MVYEPETQGETLGKILIYKTKNTFNIMFSFYLIQCWLFLIFLKLLEMERMRSMTQRKLRILKLF